MLIYAAIGAFGLLFLLAMLFLGDLFGDGDADHDVDHDADGGGPSFFSARVMSAFMTAFGVGGVVARFYELSHPAASGIGVAAGAIMGSLVWGFAKILHSQQASSELRVAKLVGQRGEVAVGIPDGGPGQITVTVGGERTTHIARSEDGKAIPPGTEVVVRAIRGDSVVVAPAAGSGAGAGGGAS